MTMHSFPGRLSLLHEMLKFIVTHAETKGFSSEGIDKIILATEEALVNVIKHGNCGDTCMVEIYCEESSPPGLRITIVDYCPPFDPIAWAKKTYSSLNSKNDFPVGGHGISLYLSIMDRVEYQRREQTNCLLLTKYL